MEAFIFIGVLYLIVSGIGSLLGGSGGSSSPKKTTQIRTVRQSGKQFQVIGTNGANLWSGHGTVRGWTSDTVTYVDDNYVQVKSATGRDLGCWSE